MADRDRQALEPAASTRESPSGRLPRAFPGLLALLLLAGAACAPSPESAAPRVRTLAAGLQFPLGLAVDQDGRVAVADFGSHSIRLVTPAGDVLTLAGGAGAGHLDGPADQARFHGPTGVAFGPRGHLYVADTVNHAIRRISPAGDVVTLAGDMVAGHADGPGPKARFDGPNGVAVDRHGTVYVADSNNHVIRRITPEGLVGTMAGAIQAPGFRDGTGAAARFHHPNGLAVDAEGHLYVTDSSNHSVRRVSPRGGVTTVATGFLFPSGLAVDAEGHLYVSDYGHHAVKVVGPDGAVTTLAGGAPGAVDGEAARSRFRFPHGVALGPGGELYVADYGNDRIRVIARLPPPLAPSSPSPRGEI